MRTLTNQQYKDLYRREKDAMYATIGRHAELTSRLEMTHAQFMRDAEAVILAYFMLMKDRRMSAIAGGPEVLDLPMILALNDMLEEFEGSRPIKIPRRRVKHRDRLMNEMEILVVKMLLEEHDMIMDYAEDEIEREQLRFGAVYQTFGKLLWNRLSPSDIDNILAEGYQGMAMSGRFWAQSGHRDYLMKQMKKTVRALELDIDTNIESLQPRLQKLFQSNASIVTSIALTEMSRVQTGTRTVLYDKNKVTRYRFVTELDGRVCDVCSSLDGQVFFTSEREEGVNAPLMHFRCRCTDYPVEVNID